jgi:hypothetical protein
MRTKEGTMGEAFLSFLESEGATRQVVASIFFSFLFYTVCEEESATRAALAF